MEKTAIPWHREKLFILMETNPQHEGGDGDGFSLSTERIRNNGKEDVEAVFASIKVLPIANLARQPYHSVLTVELTEQQIK